MPRPWAAEKVDGRRQDRRIKLRGGIEVARRQAGDDRRRHLSSRPAATRRPYYKPFVTDIAAMEKSATWAAASAEAANTTFLTASLAKIT